jgi:hypothetical protein
MAATIPSTRMHSIVRVGERAIAITVLVIAARTLAKEGFAGLARDLVLILRRLPLVNRLLSMILDGEVKGAMALLASGGKKDDATEEAGVLTIPAQGVPPAQVLIV